MYELAQVIGEDMTQEAIDAFAGRPYYFSKKQTVMQFLDQDSKEEYIKNLFFKSGRSVEYIADRIGLSVDRTRKIINKN